jgi:MGT family glycosyltransferase
MTKSHIAFFNLPAPPHVNPTLSIVSTLIRRGHRVSYVTSDRFEPVITGLGAECVLCPRLPRVSDLKHDPNWKPEYRWFTWDDIGRVYPFFIDLAVRTLSQVRGRYEDDFPDIILYDSLFFAGRVLAEQWRVPAVQTTPIFAFNDVYFTRENGVCYTPQGFVEFGEQLDRFFHAHCVDKQNNLFHKERLNIHFFPRAFQFNADSFDERFLFAGGCIGARPPEAEWENKATDGEPIILVSASTTYYNGPEYFAMLIEALKDLPWRVVISTGDMDDLSSFNRIPANVEICQYVPYPKVLPHAWLNICHAGTSTIIESMYHGVALICVSQSAEIAEYANRVEELGVGIHIRQPEITVEGIRGAVLKVAEDASMLNRVKQMQRIIRGEKVGPEEVADQIELFLTHV